MDIHSIVVADFTEVSSEVAGVEAQEMPVVDTVRELKLPHMGSKAPGLRVPDETPSQH